jgi:hypothetical protein
MNWVSRKCSSTQDKVSIKYGGTFESSHNGMQQHYVTSSLFWLNLLKPWQVKFWSGFLVRLQFHRYLFQWSGRPFEFNLLKLNLPNGFWKIGFAFTMGNGSWYNVWSILWDSKWLQAAACSLQPVTVTGMLPRSPGCATCCTTYEGATFRLGRRPSNIQHLCWSVLVWHSSRDCYISYH